MRLKIIFMIYVLFLCIGLVGYKVHLYASENKDKENLEEIDKNRSAGLFDIVDDNLEKMLMNEASYSGALGTMPEDYLLKIDRIQILDNSITSLEGLDYYAKKGLLDNVYMFVSMSSMITDFTPLKYMTNIEQINIFDAYVPNLDFLSDADLKNLSSLAFQSTQTADISGIKTANFPALEKVIFPNNGISNIDALSNFINLKEITMNNNNISDLSALSSLKYLKSITFDNNNISDISVLSDKTNLQSIDLGKNNISDISALANLTYLVSVYLSENNISDISVFEDKKYLNDLSIDNNKIYDMSPLHSYSGSIGAYNQNIEIDLGEFDDVNKIPKNVSLFIYDGTEKLTDYGLNVSDIIDYKEYNYVVNFDYSTTNFPFNGTIKVKFKYVPPIPLTPLKPSIPTEPQIPLEPSLPIVKPPKNKDNLGNDKRDENKKLITTGKDNTNIISSVSSLILILILISFKIKKVNENKTN